MQSEKEFQKKDFDSGDHSKVQNSFNLFFCLFTVTVIIVCRTFEPPFEILPNEIPDKHENKIMW